MLIPCNPFGNNQYVHNAAWDGPERVSVKTVEKFFGQWGLNALVACYGALFVILMYIFVVGCASSEAEYPR